MHRLYQAWPGANRFCCQGLAMTGSPGVLWKSSTCLHENCPEGMCCRTTAGCVQKCDPLEHPLCLEFSGANICAWSCILLPSCLYYAYAAEYLWDQVHPALPLWTIFLFFFTISCLCLACCTDPGVIPRREVILATGSRERLKEQLGYDVLGDSTAGPNDKSLENNASRVPSELRSKGYRWCTTCKIIRPPRASHCADCDNCVMRFDHHCPFVNNCVGQRNYVFFIGFTSSVCCLAAFVLPSLVYVVLRGGAASSSSKASSDGIFMGALIALACAAGLVALCVFGLWVYHLFLICTGQTTKEHWKGSHHHEDLTVFTFRGPRLFNARAWVEAVAAPEPERRQRRRALEIHFDSSAAGASSPAPLPPAEA